MKIILFSGILTFIMFAIRCDKDDPEHVVPDCVKDKIDQLEKEDCPSVSRVLEYQFNGEKVYVIHPENCGADLTSEIVDQDCNTICYLGGIAGNLTCEGVNFEDHATDERQIYP